MCNFASTTYFHVQYSFCLQKLLFYCLSPCAIFHLFTEAFVMGNVPCYLYQHIHDQCSINKLPLRAFCLTSSFFSNRELLYDSSCMFKHVQQTIPIIEVTPKPSPFLIVNFLCSFPLNSRLHLFSRLTFHASPSSIEEGEMILFT